MKSSLNCLTLKLPLIHREILALSIPAIITNITTPLLGLVDVAITGHMGSAVYIAAIAIGGSMFNLIYWLFAFLRMGTSGITAQAFGANDHRETSLTLYRSLLTASLIGIAMIALHYPMGHLLLRFLNPENDVTAIAWLYFSIGIWGAPAFLGTFALSGWFLGMQDSKAAMYVSIVINISNITLSLIFVYVLNYGIAGVAAGTLASQWIGFATGLLLCRRKRYRLQRFAIGSIIHWRKMQRFFSVNIDIFFRTMCLVAVTLWFIRAGAGQSSVILSVNTLLMQLFLLFSYFMDGFAFAGEALTGRFIGEQNNMRLRQCIKTLMLWGIVISVLFTAIYAVGGEEFLHLLSSDNAVITASSDYFWWAVAIPLSGFVAFTWDGIFIGATQTRALLLSMATAAVVFFALYFRLFGEYKNHALWLAFICYLITRGVILSFAAKRFNTTP